MGFVEPTKFTWSVDPDLDAGSRRLREERSGRRGTPTRRPRSPQDVRSQVGRRDASWNASARACRRASGSTLGPTRAASTSGPTHGGPRPSSWLRRRGVATSGCCACISHRSSRGRKINSIDWVEVELFASSMLGQRKQPQDRHGDHLGAFPDHADRDARPGHSGEPCGRALDPARRQRVRVLTMAEIDQLATHADEQVPAGDLAARADRAAVRQSCAGYA